MTRSITDIGQSNQNFVKNTLTSHNLSTTQQKIYADRVNLATMYRSTGHIAWNICVSSRLGKVWLGAMSSSAEVAVGSVDSLLSLQAWSRLSWSSSISMTISLGYCKTFFKSLCSYYHCRITSKTRASPASGYVGYGQNSKEDKISIPSLKVVKWKNKSIPVPCKSKRRS